MPTISGVTINGIDESNTYYFLNPILIEVSSTKFVTYVEVKLKNNSKVNDNNTPIETAIFKLQSNPAGIVYIDLSDYIKTISTNLNGYRSAIVSDVPNSLNAIDVDINVYTRTDIVTPVNFKFNKFFINGYSNTENTNISTNNINLTGINIPFYKKHIDLSIVRYYVDTVAKKISKNFINITDVNVLDMIDYDTCENVIFKFLNSKGSYSIIVFDSFTFTSSNKVDQSKKVKLNNFQQKKVVVLDGNVSFDREITAVSEFNSRFEDYVNEFINSQYVMCSFDKGQTFQDIEILDNTLSDTFDKSFDVTYKFKLLTSINI